MNELFILSKFKKNCLQTLIAHSHSSLKAILYSLKYLHTVANGTGCLDFVQPSQIYRILRIFSIHIQP